MTHVPLRFVAFLLACDALGTVADAAIAAAGASSMPVWTAAIHAAAAVVLGWASLRCWQRRIAA